MNRGVGAAVAVMVGVAMLLHAGIAAAEGSVPLEDLLVEKGVLTKEEAASVQQRKMSSMIDRIAFSGDMRLRNETFYNGLGTNADDRNRWRFRLRMGAELKLDTILVGIRLASGTGEQVSTNQTFDNLSSQKSLWIDRAYIRWQGDNTKWLTLTGGRMPNPFYTVYSTDVFWDDDFNPEGLAENLTFKVGGADLFVNLAQIVLDEDSGGKLDTDQWLFGQQVGATASPMEDLKTTLALAYYNAVNVQNGTLGQVAVQNGNSRCSVGPPAVPAGCVANQLINDYNVIDVTALVAFKAMSLPMSVMADYVTNTADTVDATGAGTDNSGYQLGLIAGKASNAQTWELGYFYKSLGTDATLADITDSDWGNGGTGRKGSILWAAYSPTKVLQFKAKYFKTKLVDEQAGPNDINRLQADVVVKF